LEHTLTLTEKIALEKAKTQVATATDDMTDNPNESLEGSPDHRKNMSPQLFESLMCLKYNQAFWDDDLIVQAYRNAREQKSTERYQKLDKKAKQHDKEMEAAKGLVAIFKHLNLEF
jgi:rhamnogalacturonyl hydrolase YesR